MLPRNCAPHIFKQLSQLNQNTAGPEHHSDPLLCGYCIKHDGNHHVGITCRSSPELSPGCFTEIHHSTVKML